MSTIGGTTRLAALIGSPVAHSLSPVLHNTAFAAAGLDWVYAAFDVQPGRAAAALDAMRVLGLGGLSVTMPHKEAIAAAVDELDDAATALHSVNTVSVLGAGRLMGHSTDGAGFIAALADAGVDPRRQRVVVLGAGGAARAVIAALGLAGAAAITVVNRTPARAAVAAGLSAVAAVGDASAVAEADLVVNATPIGMGPAASGSIAGGELPLDAGLLRPGLVVADLVYHPLSTPLLAAAAAVGAHTVDGLGMLVHQAVLQQRIWTGISPDPELLRAAALRELAARHA